MTDFPAGPAALLGALTAALRDRPEISGLWLEGSLSRGDGDDYSDVDLHLLSVSGWAEDALGCLRASLASAMDLVYWRAISPRMATAMTADGARFDLVLENTEEMARPREAVRIVHDRERRIATALRVEPPAAAPDAGRVAAAISEFWRCLALLPTVVTRRERLAAYQGHALMVGMATEIALASEGRARLGGAKRLNASLSPDAADRLGASLPEGASIADIVDAQLRLAGFVAEWGRRCAESLGFPYPCALEAAASRHVERSIAGLAEREPALSGG